VNTVDVAMHRKSHQGCKSFAGITGFAKFTNLTYLREFHCFPEDRSKFNNYDNYYQSSEILHAILQCDQCCTGANSL